VPSLALALTSDAELFEAPAPDLSSAPGAKLAWQRAWALAPGERVDAWCARGRPPLWVAGMEAIVMDGATVVAAKHAGLRGAKRGTVASEGAGLQASFTAEGAWGRHIVGFFEEGGDPQLLACTVVCQADGPELCERIVESAEVDTPLVRAPEAGVVANAVAAAAGYPQYTLGGVALAGFALAATILCARPRPRR